MLAQYAMNASNKTEVKNNIAKGMSVLGPTITLDTIVETLVIGVGTLSGKIFHIFIKILLDIPKSTGAKFNG